MTRDREATARAERIQLASLLRLVLGQAYRKGISPLNGAIIRPVRSVVGNLALLGAFSALGFRFVTSDAAYWSAVFLTALVITMLAIMPETLEARQASSDVLACRPLSGRTRLLGVSISLAAGASLVTASYGLAPAILAAAWRGTPWPLAIQQYLLMVFMGALAGVLWMHAMSHVIRLVGAETLRKASMVLVAGLTLALCVAGLAGDAAGAIASGLPPQVAEPAGAIIRALPSGWFATLLLPGASSPLAATGVVVTIAAAASLGFLGDADRRWRILVERMAEREEIRAASKPKVGWSPTAFLVRSASPLLSPGARAVAEILVLHGEREDLNKLRRLLNVVISGLFFALALVTREPSSLAMLSYTIALAVVDGLVSVQQVRDPDVAWILPASPLPRRDIVSGIQATLLARMALVPVGLMLVAIAVVQSPSAALLLGGAIVVGVRAMSSLILLARPLMPLSQSSPPLQGMAGFALAVVLSIGGLIGGAILLAIASMGLLGSALVALVVLLAVIPMKALEHAAARRIQSAEAG